jgi:integrase
MIRSAMTGIRTKYAAPQAEALKPETARGILAELKDSDARLDRRDAALVALLFASALRRSEIAGLDYAAAGEGDGYLQLTDKAVEIVLLRSKARTEPVTVLVPRAENPGLVAALESWVAIAGIADGEPLFRSIKKGGHIRDRLRDGDVRVALYLQACGYTPDAAETAAAKHSGHSGRVGMYTAASEAGIPIVAVAALARHKSLNVVQKYARKARPVEEPGAGDLAPERGLARGWGRWARRRRADYERRNVGARALLWTPVHWPRVSDHPRSY